MGLLRGGDSLTDDIGLASRGAEARPSIPTQTLRPPPSDSNGRGVPCGTLELRGVPFGHPVVTGRYVGQHLPQCIPSSNILPQLCTSAAHPPPFFSGSGTSTNCTAALHPHAAAEVPPDTHVKTAWSQRRAANFDADAAETACDGQSTRISAALSSSTGLVQSPVATRLRIEERCR